MTKAINALGVNNSNIKKFLNIAQEDGIVFKQSESIKCGVCQKEIRKRIATRNKERLKSVHLWRV